MDSTRGFAPLIALGVIAIGCATAPPPPADPAPAPAKTGPSPKSAEWLYATDGVSGGHRAECRAVPGRLDQETRCKGALCEHGAALAKDWLSTCKASTPEVKSHVQDLAQELEKRAKRTPAPCEAEVAGILSDGCSERKDCRAFVQSWATRCADYSTPLVLRMLEVAVEREVGEHVSIDGRSCAELFAPVEKAASCDHPFKCQDSLDALKTYRARCETPGKPIELGTAVVEASLLAGASQDVPPIPVVPSGAAIAKGLVPLPLDGGTGAVLLVCGKRATDVAAYLSARASCTEDMVIARRFEDKGSAVLRVGHVPVTSDASFRKRFRSLAVAGELRARDEVELPAFEHDVDQAIELSHDRKHAREAIRAFVAAVVAHVDAVRHSKVFETAIRKRDTALTPLFQAIGRAKKTAMHPELTARRLAPALRRASVHVLADVNADGKVKIGESTIASSVELEDMLPQATAAYREELSSRFARLAKLELSTGVREKLTTDAGSKLDRCADAWKRAHTAERTFIACVFGQEPCDDARRTTLVGELDGARQDVEAEYLESALAVSSLDDAERANVQARPSASDCHQP